LLLKSEEKGEEGEEEFLLERVETPSRVVGEEEEEGEEVEEEDGELAESVREVDMPLRLTSSSCCLLGDF
jgi:hypothetical protein